MFGRPGLGVAVLPPIGMSRPLSPYISPVVVAPLPSVQPPPPPSFRLVDPRANLSPEQKVELDSLVAMGFPPPRVARALLRSGDKSKASVVVVVVVRKLYLMHLVPFCTGIVMCVTTLL